MTGASGILRTLHRPLLQLHSQWSQALRIRKNWTKFRFSSSCLPTAFWTRCSRNRKQFRLCCSWKPSLLISLPMDSKCRSYWLPSWGVGSTPIVCCFSSCLRCTRWCPSYSCWRWSAQSSGGGFLPTPTASTSFAPQTTTLPLASSSLSEQYSDQDVPIWG